MRNKYIYVILFAIVLLIVVGLVFFLKKDSKESNGLEKDEQIGRLLLEGELGGKIYTDKMKVSYDEKSNVFEAQYTITNDKESSNDDEVVISTSDFVVYSVSTTHFTNGVPLTNSINGTETVNYEVKNKVIKLAKELNYNVGEVLTVKQYEKVLEILKKTKLEKNIKLFEKNGYELDNYYSQKNDVVGFYYKGTGNYYLVIKNDKSYKEWNLYGFSKEKLNDDFYASQGDFVLNERITLTDKQAKEMKNIIKDYLG